MKIKKLSSAINKRVVSGVLAIIMSMSFLPVDILANKQEVVTDTTIANLSGATEGSYSWSLSWSNPMPSAEPDGTFTDFDPTSAYEILYRNGTKNEAYVATKNLTPPATIPAEGATMTQNYTKDLDEGAVYSFKVRPIHYHTVVTPEGTTRKEAAYTTTQQSEVLYLTDIVVNASVSGNEVTVVWDNPTYMGTQLFSAYRIYYQENADSIIGNMTTTQYVSVDIADAVKQGNKLSYTFSIPDIKVGIYYAIKVEPMVANGASTTLFRKPSSVSNTITIKDRDYKISYTNREYRNNETYVSPKLYIEPDGLSNIRLYWDSLSSNDSVPVKLEIQSSYDETFETNTVITTMYGDTASTTNYYSMPAPDTLMYYRFKYTYKNNAGEQKIMYSNVVFWDSAYKYFDPYKPIIESGTGISSANPSITIDWDAFLRKPLNSDELSEVVTGIGLYEDKNVTYNVWITDDVQNVTNLEVTDSSGNKTNSLFYDYYIAQIPANSLTGKEYIKADGSKTLVYEKSFTQYASVANGTVTKQPLITNQIYYIAIQAIRTPGGDTSDIEYYALYIEPFGDITVPPVTMARPPLKILKDDEGVDQITVDSIGIEWDNTWYEVYDEKSDAWYSSVGVLDNGTLVFGEDRTSQLDPDKVVNLYADTYNTGNFATDVQLIKTTLTQMGCKDDVGLLPFRFMDLNGAGYEIHVVEYDYLDSQGGYEAYLETLTDDMWRQITPLGDTVDPYYIVKQKDAEASGTLDPDTTYVIYFRSYRTKNGEKVYAYNPSYVLGTTLYDRVDPDVIPPTAVLEEISHTDVSAIVGFKGNSQYKYELRYSNNPKDYTASGVVLTDEMIRSMSEITPLEGDEEYQVNVNIEGLFPDTSYYFWIKVIAGNTSSNWSAPIEVKTDPLQKPATPRGLSLISKENIEVINVNNDVKYKRVDKDYAVLEWIRIPKDQAEQESGITAYDENEILFDEYMKRFPAVKFNNLIAYTDYYARVRTILTVERNGVSGDSYYAYEIQLSEDRQFTEADNTIVIVFDSELVPDDKDILQTTSDWSAIFRVRTEPTNDEYDGNINPDHYPVPPTDFDISFDDATGTLVYEWRGSGVDSNGVANNLADQRFISKMVDENMYDFYIDMSTYNGKKINRRELIMPYRIVDAFDQYQASVTVKADNMTLSIEPNSFDTFAINKNIADYGNNSKVAFVFTEKLSSYYGVLKPTQTFESKPQALEMTVTTPTRSEKVSKLANDFSVSMKLNNRYNMQEANVGLYKIDPNNPNLVLMPSVYNDTTGALVTNTSIPSTFVAVAQKPVTNVKPDDYYYSMISNFNVNDMSSYNKDTTINAHQFNNIVAAVAKGEESVSMTRVISQEDFTSLGRAKMLVSGTTVTREQGISSMVKLYELRMGTKINVTQAEINNTPNINTASSANKEAIAKAYKVGLYDTSRGGFGSLLTIDETLYMVDSVLIAVGK